MSKTGSVRKVVIEAITFLIAGDADLSEILTQFENSTIPTSGDAILKQEKRQQDVSDVILITNGIARERLRVFADSGDTLKMSYTNRAGDVHRFSGQINVDNNQTMESRTNVTFLSLTPRSVDLV